MKKIISYITIGILSIGFIIVVGGQISEKEISDTEYKEIRYHSKTRHLESEESIQAKQLIRLKGLKDKI
jgi:hypothetical protein